MAKPEPDLRDQLRNNTVHRRQVLDALAEAQKQRDAAFRGGADLAELRKLDKRVADLKADAGILAEQAKSLADQAREAERQRIVQEREAEIAKRATAAADVLLMITVWNEQLKEVAAGCEKIIAAFEQRGISPGDFRERLKDAGRQLQLTGRFERFPHYLNYYFAGDSLHGMAAVDKTFMQCMADALDRHINNLREQPLPQPRVESDDEDDNESEAAA
jgi:hypothetical protein